jgi:hypothetical protein
MATVLVTTAIARFPDGVVFGLFAGLAAVAGQIPQIEGDLRLGLSVAGALDLALFDGLLWALFRFRPLFAREGPLVCRAFDRLATWLGAAVLGKLVAVTHLVWAGLAVGLVPGASDCLFPMVLAGFAMVTGRFVRIPASFVPGAGFALDLLGVPGEKALLMVLFDDITTVALVVGIGLAVLWQSGIDIRRLGRQESMHAGRAGALRRFAQSEAPAGGTVVRLRAAGARPGARLHPRHSGRG